MHNQKPFGYGFGCCCSCGWGGYTDCYQAYQGPCCYQSLYQPCFDPLRHNVRTYGGSYDHRLASSEHPQSQQRYFTYIPYMRRVMDYQNYEFYRPVVKLRRKYYAKTTETSYVPKEHIETEIDYVPVEKEKFGFRYIPIEVEIIHYPIQQHKNQGKTNLTPINGQQTFGNSTNSALGQPTQFSFSQKLPFGSTHEKNLFSQMAAQGDHANRQSGAYRGTLLSEQEVIRHSKSSQKSREEQLAHRLEGDRNISQGNHDHFEEGREERQLQQRNEEIRQSQASNQYNKSNESGQYKNKKLDEDFRSGAASDRSSGHDKNYDD